MNNLEMSINNDEFKNDYIIMPDSKTSRIKLFALKLLKIKPLFYHYQSSKGSIKGQDKRTTLDFITICCFTLKFPRNPLQGGVFLKLFLVENRYEWQSHILD